MTRARPVGALLMAMAMAMAVVLGGCGGDAEDLSTAAAAILNRQVADVRAAVGAGDRDEAEVGLGELRGTVARLRGQGEVGGDRAERILAAAARVEGQLALLTPTTRPTAPVQSPRVDPGEDADLDDDGEVDDVERRVEERVEEAERRTEERLREAEQKVEDAKRKAEKAGKGNGGD